VDGCRKHRQLPRLPGEYLLSSRRRRHALYHYRGSQQPVRDARWLVCKSCGAYTRRRSKAHSGGGLLPGREGSDLAGANTRGQKWVRPKQGGTYRQEGSVSRRQGTVKRGRAGPSAEAKSRVYKQKVQGQENRVRQKETRGHDRWERGKAGRLEGAKRADITHGHIGGEGSRRRHV